MSMKLEDMHTLKKDWNGYGADPIPPENIKAAQTLAAILDEAGVKYVTVPGSDGDIWFENVRLGDIETIITLGASEKIL